MPPSEHIDPRRRILAVDKVELDPTLPEAVLRGATYDVDSVAEGAAALEAIGERPYDLVLKDLEMPGLDGHAAAAICRSRADVVRFAALSSRRGEADIRRRDEAGMAAHFARPIAPHALLREIERLPLAGPTDGKPADPWQRTSYDEWAAKLGEERMRGILRVLDGQLRDLLSLARTDPSDTLHRLAHDVASTAGMLGFAEVTRRCRAVLEEERNGETPAVAALATALEAAILRLAGHFATDARAA